MKKRILLIAALLLLSLLTSCSQPAKTAGTPANSKMTVITDCANRKVSVPVNVKRIAALYAPVGDILALLGHGNDIVAVPGGLKRDKLLTTLYPTINQAVVPMENSKINLEELLRVKPDILFINLDTLNGEGQKEKLDKLGIPYLVIDFQSIAMQQQAIKIVGQIVHENQKANQYIDYYNQKMNDVTKRVANIPLKDQVKVYHSINEATRTDVPNTLPADWLEKVGAINVSIKDHNSLKLVDNNYFASLEQILLWNPDVILANEPGVDDYIRTKDQWRNIKAVKEHRVYLLPNGLTRWGHPGSIEVPLAMLWTGKTLYPNLFEDINMEAETKNFYQTFFSLSLTDEQVSQILSGKGMRIGKGGNEK